MNTLIASVSIDTFVDNGSSHTLIRLQIWKNVAKANGRKLDDTKKCRMIVANKSTDAIIGKVIYR